MLMLPHLNGGTQLTVNNRLCTIDNTLRPDNGTPDQKSEKTLIKSGQTKIQS
jgi:hypothetical protein